MVHLAVDKSSPCVFTKDTPDLYLPVRHGEGKLIGRDADFSESLIASHLAVLRYADPVTWRPTMTYPYNPNGSESAIAGVCDKTGRVFGLMPHPECFVHQNSSPSLDSGDPSGRGCGFDNFQECSEILAGELSACRCHEWFFCCNSQSFAVIFPCSPPFVSLFAFNIAGCLQ